MRVLVSIDIKGIFIKILQFLDIPVIGFHALLNIFFLVSRVLPEAGLDLRCGCWSECSVVSGDEIQMPVLQLKLRTQRPFPKILCVFAYHSSLEVPLSTLGWGFKTTEISGQVICHPCSQESWIFKSQEFLLRWHRESAASVYILHTRRGKIPITCPMLQVQKHFQICSRSNPKVACFSCNLWFLSLKKHLKKPSLKPQHLLKIFAVVYCYADAGY